MIKGMFRVYRAVVLDIETRELIEHSGLFSTQALADKAATSFTECYEDSDSVYITTESESVSTQENTGTLK